MGYSYWNDCEELGTSYNHAFYFYKYLDKEKGLRFIYGKRGRDVLPFLLKMRSALQGSPAAYHNYCQIHDEYDGWYPSIGNALWFLEKIIAACIRSPNGKWSGD